MPPLSPTPGQEQSFRTAADFEAWMSTHHDRADEIWMRVYKAGSGVPSITIGEALDVVLCWGWIDGLRRGLDEVSYLQRYTPRRPKSLWSQVNREHIARLTAAGRMTPHGQRQVDLAKADGRWDAAYAPVRTGSVENIPDDLRAAIDVSPRALETFRTLSKQNLFALTFRVTTMRTAAGRAKKVAALVAMLERGDTPVPQKPRR